MVACIAGKINIQRWSKGNHGSSCFDGCQWR